MPPATRVADLRIRLGPFTLCPADWKSAREAPGGLAPPMIELGEPDFDTRTATMGVDIHCGSMCGEGRTFTLRKYEGAWRIVGENRGWVG